MPKTRWTEDMVRRFLDNEQLGYQKIALPFGLSTPGHERSATCDAIFGGDLEGKSVLDVGSHLGYFCIEALRRGACRAVGWEIDPEHVRQARTIADMVDSSAEYYERDIEGEVADIFCYLLSFAATTGIDLSTALHRKMVKNREKYPAEQFRGRF